MRNRIQRFGVWVVAGALGALATAGLAGATTTSAPAAPDFTNAVNTYGTSLANGLMPILLAVLGVAAVFTLYKIGVHAIRSWIGKGKATNAVS